MKAWQVYMLILLTSGIVVTAIVVLSMLSPASISGPIIWVTILGTSIWAAIDSSKIGLYKYRSQIAVRPFVLFVACFLFGGLAFPWYLVVRYTIKNGLSQLKEQYQSETEIIK